MKKLLLFLLTVSILSTGYAQTEVSPFELTLFTDFPHVRDLVISPRGNELYFTAESMKKEFSAIMVSYKIDGAWTSPQVASFSGQYQDLEPFMSSDGLTLYFASNRPVDEDRVVKPNFDIWKAERSTPSSRWQTPVNLGAPINTDEDEFYPSVADNGNLYFTASREGGQGKEDIYVVKYENRAYGKPFVLPSQINTSGYEFNAFIAPDESYILFTGYQRDDGLGSGDIYISERLSEAIWKPAVPLPAKINSTGMDYCPLVHQGVLYFTSNRSAIKDSYEDPLSVKELISVFNQTENGRSRIYQAEITGLLKGK